MNPTAFRAPTHASGAGTRPAQPVLGEVSEGAAEAPSED